MIVLMAFCTNCGARLPEGARFCVGCGQVAERRPGMRRRRRLRSLRTYTIVGDNLQIARVHLKSGQEVYAEAGKMVYKTPNVEWETRMTGNTLGEKLLGRPAPYRAGRVAISDLLSRCRDGEVGFAGHYPGRIQMFDLAPGQSILAQRDAFLFAQPTVQFNVALVKRLGAGFFGGEGFILEKLTGPGAVFIHAGGDFVQFTCRPGRRSRSRPGASSRLTKA